jgi:hypothetical protein
VWREALDDAGEDWALTDTFATGSRVPADTALPLPSG